MSLPDLPTWAENPVLEYLARLRTQRNLSPNTIEAYRRDLSQCFDYCARSGVKDIRDVERGHARRFVAFLDTRRYSRTSLTRKASAVRAFFSDAGRRGQVESNPFEGVAPPGRAKSLPHALPVR